jgi:2-oxoisovalerate dehydrogenase E1 component
VKGNDNVAVSFFGDGAINHGVFHESINFAAVRNAPVVFVCENNLYATVTPTSSASLNSNISSKAAAYGIPGITVDGNDVLAVHKATVEAIDRARKGHGPTLIEAMTYRTVGHHEGDPVAGTYRTREELETWKKKSPILRFENYLIETGNAKKEDIDSIHSLVYDRITEALEFARSSEYPKVSTVLDNCWMEPINPSVAFSNKSEIGESVNQSWLVAVRDGIAEEMRKNKNIIYLGEGIGERGGTFAHTKNLWKEFGGERIIDTPICELAFTGAAASASAVGCRTIADLMFADFIFESTSQIINQASKLRYMSNGQLSVPMIVRAGSGQIKQAGPHHSGTYHSIWSHIPGLLVAVPSTPADAKGLMKTALRAGNPVIFLEPKALFSSKGPVPLTEHYVPFGQAKIIEEGDNITIVTFGLPVFNCIEAGQKLKEQGISCEIIDLRTIVPLDIESIIKSVCKTGYILVVEEGYPVGSFGSEISAIIMENCFEKLKGPVGRLNKDNVPQPFSPVLEVEVTITPEKIFESVTAVLKRAPLKPRGIAKNSAY